MPTYHCRPADWRPEDATEVAGDTPRYAAEKFREEHDAASCDYPLSMDVAVTLPDGTEQVFEVEMESVPVYHARKKT